MDYKEIETLSDERMDELFSPCHSNLALSLSVWRKVSEGAKTCINAEWGSKYEIDFEQLEGSDELYALLKTLGWSEEEMENVCIYFFTSEAGLDIADCTQVDVARLADAIYDNNIDLSDDELCAKLKAMQECDSYRYGDLVTAIEEEAKWEYYPNMTAAEYEERLIMDCYPEVWDAIESSGISSYITIDYEELARDDDIFESSNGVLRPY